MTIDDAMELIDHTDGVRMTDRGYAALRRTVQKILAQHAADVRGESKPATPTLNLDAPPWVRLTTTADRLKLKAGDVVAVQMDDGGVVEYVVRSPAWQSCGPALEGADWVIGIAGGYLLTRVLAKKHKE